MNDRQHEKVRHAKRRREKETHRLVALARASAQLSPAQMLAELHKRREREDASLRATCVRPKGGAS